MVYLINCIFRFLEEREYVMELKVSIVILNWNGWKDTIECLESLYKISYNNYNVIVVDNNSNDNSIETIKKYIAGELVVDSTFLENNVYGKPNKYTEYTKEKWEKIIVENKFKSGFDKELVIIKNDNNDGFAEGNNIAIKKIINVADCVLLLNNDTVVYPDFLTKLVEVIKSNEDIGIVGPIVYHYNEADKIQSLGGNVYWKKGIAPHITKMDNLNSKSIIEVDYVMGCCLLAKCELFKKVGLLNKDFFAYWEETDFCTRVKKMDYRIVSTSDSKIWHKGGSTTKKTSGFYEYHITRNRFWFMRKNASKIDYMLFLAYFFVFDCWVLTYVYIRNKNFQGFSSFTKGLIDGLNEKII